jgi:hypothetical protein
MSGVSAGFYRLPYVKFDSSMPISNVEARKKYRYQQSKSNFIENLAHVHGLTPEEAKKIWYAEENIHSRLSNLNRIRQLRSIPSKQLPTAYYNVPPKVTGFQKGPRKIVSQPEPIHVEPHPIYEKVATTSSTPERKYQGFNGFYSREQDAKSSYTREIKRVARKYGTKSDEVKNLVALRDAAEHMHFPPLETVIGKGGYYQPNRGDRKTGLAVPMRNSIIFNRFKHHVLSLIPNLSLTQIKKLFKEEQSMSTKLNISKLSRRNYIVSRVTAIRKRNAMQKTKKPVRKTIKRTKIAGTVRRTRKTARKTKKPIRKTIRRTTRKTARKSPTKRTKKTTASTIARKRRTKK